MHDRGDALLTLTHCCDDLRLDVGDLAELGSDLLLALVLGLYFDEFGIAITLCLLLGLGDQGLTLDLFDLQLGVCFDLGLLSLGRGIDLSHRLLGLSLHKLQVSCLERHLLREVLINVVSCLVLLLSEQLQSLGVINKLHVIVVLFFLHLVQ